MCTYSDHSTEVKVSVYAHGEWIDVRRAVVSFDHPQEAPVSHALCIDFRADGADPGERVALELDAASARRLAEAVLEVLATEDACQNVQ